MRVTSELHRLIARHAFLKREWRLLEDERPTAEADAIKRQLELVREAIVTYRTDRADETIEQLRFLISSVVEGNVRRDEAGVLGALSDHRLDKLKSQIAAAERSLTKLAAMNFRYLDSLADRISVIDAEYRYEFTNAANISFHRSSARSFIGRPLWSAIGEDVFEKHMKAKIDAALAGRSITLFSRRIDGDVARLFAVTIDPITGDDSRLGRVIIVGREISNIDVRVDGIVPIRPLREPVIASGRLDGGR